jgi:hypothetical protein
MPSGRRVLAALACVAVVPAGCSSAVDVSPAPEAPSAACAAASRHWPATVGNQRPVDTSSSSGSVHAWGDPAVIVRCGVPAPGPSTDDCLGVDGIDWLAHPLSDGTRFTTYGRSPAIEVLVPRAYDPGGLLLPAFTAAARTIPQAGRHCTG